MASPFAVFRRNQRVMIAVCGIMAMVAFVFLDPVFRMLGGTQRPDNPLMVKTNYGNYKRSDLDAVEHQRKWVEIFLQRIVAARVQKDFEDRQMPQDSRQLQMYARYMYSGIHQQLMGRVLPAGDAAAIETIVLAKRAEEMGMVASDNAVIDLLRMIAGDSFSQLRDIIAALKPDGRISIGQGYLFDGLRREMLASKYSEMFRLAVRGMPPAERWEYFERLNLNAEAQVLPVKAEQFLKEVPQPGDEKLQAFFERYQNQLPQPNSPEPGFKEPAKIAFQYFQANLEKFIDRTAEQVTPEEMHDYYEKNKAIQFRQLSLPGAKDKEAPAKEGEMEDPLGPDDPQPDKSTPPKTSDSAAEKKDSSPNKKDAQKKDADTDDADTSEQPDSGNAGKKSSRALPGRGPSPFRLTSAPQPAAAKKTPAAAAAGAKTSDAAPPGEKAAKAPAAEESPPGEQPGQDDAAKSPAAEEPAAEEPATGEKKSEPKYEPFEKVEETIRKQLAREKAQTAIKEAFDALHSKMRAYTSARSAYLANKEDDPELKEPEPLNFAALAEEFGVEAKETELISAYEAQTQTDIGKSYVGQVSFLQLAYLDPHLYRPELTLDDENNSYLWWETKSTPELVPSFEDVRGKVLHAYKMVEARKLALAQAEKYAKQANAAKKPLNDVFKDREDLEVINTGPFTRMTIGNMPLDPDSSEPRLSPVHGVEAAGEEFMNAVFSLSPGEVKVASNQPQDIAYVIQLERFRPDRNLLEREFIVEPFQKYARVADDDQRQLYLTWTKTLEQDAGVDWVEPPRTETHVEEE